MNKILSTAFLTLLISTALLSCKKGPEDPAISLTPRNWKITGTWYLQSMQSDYSIENNTTDSVYFTNDKTDYNVEFDGTDMVTVIDNVEDVNSLGGQFEFTSNATITNGWVQVLNIEKNGTYTMVTTVEKKSYEYSDSEGELITDTYSNTDSVVTKSGHWRWGDAKKEKTWLVLDDVGYYLLRLSNKEMKWERSWEETVDESEPGADDKWSDMGSATHTWEKQ